MAELSPQTREEHFLARIAGDSTALVLEPVTRIEHFLQRIIDTGVSVPPEKIAGAASAWLEENITNPDSPPLDTSLSVANAAADSKTVGDKLATGVIGRPKLTASDDMNDILTPGIYDKSVNVSVAHAPDNSSAARARVIVFNGDTNYDIVQIWCKTFSNEILCRTKSGVNSDWTSWLQLATTTDIDTALETALVSRSVLTSSDNINNLVGPGMYYKNGTTALAGDVPPNANTRMARIVVFSGGSAAAGQLWFDCGNKQLHFRIRGLTTSAWSDWFLAATGADITQLRTELLSATTYSLDTSELSWSMGGVQSDGKGTSSKTRLRLKGPDGRGGILVNAGSTITANTGYKFNVALYSSYTSAGNFDLIGFRNMATGSYTVEQDCYIRISIGTTDDDELWQIDPDTQVRSLTEAGVAAESDALTLSLINGDVKTKIDGLEESIQRGGERVMELKDALPLNSADYHALWNDMVDAGFAARTQIGTTSHDSGELPIYQYAIRSHMAHLAANYAYVAWDGSNQIYDRPKILLVAGQHGNERTPPSMLWDFANHLWTDPAYQELRDAFDWTFIPLVNPWGYSHSCYKNGVLNNGKGYMSTTKDQYTVVDNTSSVHQGIRRNCEGFDINRDYGETSTTPEAQALRSALSALTTGGAQLTLMMDCHQADGSTSDESTEDGARAAFVSLQAGATSVQRSLVYGRFMQAASKSMNNLADWLGINNDTQTMYPWEGSELLTLRNFGADYANHSLCYESGQNCTFYSGITGAGKWSNPVARAVGNTQMHNFLLRLTEAWM